MFFFKISNLERFFPAQEIFFIFCALLLWGIVLYKFNKYIGFLMALFSFSFLRTSIFCFAPQTEIYKITISVFSVSLIYFFIRYIEAEEDILKFLFIPVFLNIGLIILQAFDHKFIPFIPVEGITGFLGNKSITGYYLAMTLPLFLKKQKGCLLLIAMALFLCQSFFGILASLITILIYVFFEYRKLFKWILLSILSLSGILCFVFYLGIIENIKFRLCMWLTTLSGIKYNPVLGWGIGSYEMVMSQIKPNESIFFGYSFNTLFKVNHPHNEILYGWWMMGIAFPFLCICFFVDFIKGFSNKKIIPFLIVVAGCICAMGCFLNPPLWFLFAIALAIYENKKGAENANN